MPDSFVGVLFHAIGGFAAGSFYIPFKKVRGWAWETYWLVGGLFIWVFCPLIVALITVPQLPDIYRQSSWSGVLLPILFGIGWGIGHLTFGLTLRYLGLSLGMGLVLGFCTFFGTLIPPIFKGTFLGLFVETSGQLSLAGIAICLFGILFCSWAGMSKERELPEEAKKETVAEFDFLKGVWIAFFSGVMSACFAFGVEAGNSLQELAESHDVEKVYANNAPLLLILVGGGISNLVWCITLNVRNGSGNNYVDRGAPLVRNYAVCMLAGVVGYAEFFFFGMGESKMGNYGVFASWPIHMAFVIAFSNVWGLIFREWAGTSARTKRLLFVGLLLLLGSTFVSGYGSRLKQLEEQTAPAPAASR